MIYNIIDNDNDIVYGNFKVNKNASSKTILNKMKLELQKIFKYDKEIKTNGNYLVGGETVANFIKKADNLIWGDVN